MAEISEIICVTCPKGCTLRVKHEGKEVLEVLDGCKRGEEYAICELQDPRRMVASTVRVEGGLHPLVPVYTRKAFPKHLIPELAPLAARGAGGPPRSRSTRLYWPMPSAQASTWSPAGICRWGIRYQELGIGLLGIRN